VAAAAGRSAKCANAIPPTQATTPATCTNSAAAASDGMVRILPAPGASTGRAIDIESAAG
jgi:hypothetical protein